MITCYFEDGGKAGLRHVVVHAIVEKENKLLLVKRTGKLLESGKWSIPTGFLERNESVEQGMLRELKEETGWTGKVTALFRIISNPNRPNDADRQSVAFEFLITPIQQVSQPDVLENSALEWVAIENISAYAPFAFDNGETLELYLKYRQNSFPLPVLS